MRTILHSDLVTATRALLAVPTLERATKLDQMLEQAHAAHQFHKRLKRPHPEWGNGSLVTRAGKERLADEPHASDLEYLDALHLVIFGLICWKKVKLTYRSGKMGLGLSVQIPM